MLHLPLPIAFSALVPLGLFGVLEGKFQAEINLPIVLFPYSIANHLRAAYILQYASSVASCLQEAFLSMILEVLNSRVAPS